MRTIDEQLIELVQSSMGRAYEELSSPDAWTRETRDTMVEKSRRFNEQLSVQGVELVERLCQEQLDGHPVLYWFIFRGVLLGELELFIASRGQIDAATDEQIKDSAFDHSWLTEQIRTRYAELTALDEKLEPYNLDVSEEL